MDNIACRFSYPIFTNNKNGFTVALYSPVSPLAYPDGKEIKTFAAAGTNLPTTPNLEYVLSGSWKYDKKDEKDRWTFSVQDYQETMPNSKDGIIKYLSTLQGVGPVTAKRIYEEFGDAVFSILETTPENFFR